MILGKKNRHIDKWNRIEGPEISLYSYSKVNLDKGAKNICWRKGSLFNKWCWENWIYTCTRLKLDSLLMLYKNQLKWIKYLNVKPETETTMGKLWEI
jgi:hypothetical protein